jgi:hypothetical protein
MRLRRNEYCPIHKSISCCGREPMLKPRTIRLGVQRVEDPHHPRGYRELRSTSEMRRLLNLQLVWAVMDGDLLRAVSPSTDHGRYNSS